MNLHEYQAKQLFKQAGIPIPRGLVERSAERVGQAFTELGGKLAVVKAQVHAGGRGQGGGVQLVRSAEEAKAKAAAILSKPLVTKQTGPKGVPVRTLLVDEGVAFTKELYLGIVLDRAAGYPVVMASTSGGMDIEEVAAKTPHLIHKVHITSPAGLAAHEARSLFFKLARDGKLDSALARPFCDVVMKLSRLYLERDCSLVEINPLVVTADGKVMALDGKLSVDDSALYRHADLAGDHDASEENPAELRAAKANLSYIALDGQIGCMVNGAGLAMATMDIIKYYGAEPANFLDVGGGATAERVSEAFRIITSDPRVKAILINIFGGIVKCDLIAQGVIAAVKETGLAVPLVVRLEGTNVDLGRKLLKESGLNLVAAGGLAEAAKAVVELAKGRT